MMKRLTILLLILCSLSASGQLTISNYYGYKTTTAVTQGSHKVDSLLYLPGVATRTPTWAGAIRYNAADSSLYYWTGYQWKKPEGSGGGALTDGDKGEITVSGGTWSIDNGTIGPSKLSATGTPSAATVLAGDNTWKDAATFNYTDPQPGQHLVIGPDGATVINDPNTSVGSADSIYVYGTAEKVRIQFRRSDTALLITDGETTFAFKQSGSGSSEPASSPYDAYFTNLATAGLTLTATQQGYFNDFYSALTAAGATITEHYPFMGSTATTQAVTVKGKTVTWGGDVGHNAKGIVMQFTSTGYVGLGVAPSADFELDNFAALWYNVNGDAGAVSDMGCGSNQFALRSVWSDGSCYADIWDGSTNRASGTNSTVTGSFLAFRNAGTIKLYRNTTEIATASVSGGTLPGLEVYLGGINSSGSVIQRTNRDVSQVIFLKGVTAANAAAVMSAWNTLNTNLGKN